MMNKKYMDFVPASSKVKAEVKETPKRKVSAARKTAPKVVAAKKPEPVVRQNPEVVRKEVVLQEDILEKEAETFSLKKEPQYGVIEDFRPKFVKTEVEKRPLSRVNSASAVKKDELTEAKAVKVAAKKLEKPVKPVKKPVEKSEKADKVDDNSKMKIPKSPFINQAKVAKRPLSKNIYERTVKPTEEVPTGPVTIISKPEKDTKVGRVVAIILAIILGAAAGTVAFLLLPK